MALSVRAPGKQTGREIHMNAETGTMSVTLTYDDGSIIVMTLSGDGTVEANSPNRTLVIDDQEILVLKQ